MNKILISAIGGLLPWLAFSQTAPAIIQNPLHAELQMLTERRGTACGLVAYGQDPASAWACAERAEKKGAPYWVAIQRDGIDSDFWVAALLTPSGMRYILHYDSNPRGGPDLMPKFVRESCGGKVVLDMRRQNVLQCLRAR